MQRPEFLVISATKRRLCLVVVMILVSGRLAADDWPQWRGLERNGISRETGWLSGWAQGRPPKVAWRAAVGKGHSAMSVSGSLAFTMGWDGEQDSVFCFDAVTGRLIWKQIYCRSYVAEVVCLELNREK